MEKLHQVLIEIARIKLESGYWCCLYETPSDFDNCLWGVFEGWYYPDVINYLTGLCFLGYISGCGCGCRGDWELDSKGWDLLEKLKPCTNKETCVCWSDQRECESWCTNCQLTFARIGTFR